MHAADQRADRVARHGARQQKIKRQRNPYRKQIKPEMPEDIFHSRVLSEKVGRGSHADTQAAPVVSAELFRLDVDQNQQGIRGEDRRVPGGPGA